MKTHAPFRIRIVAATVLACFLPLSSAGCFGGFELTRKIHRFNERVDPDRWRVWGRTDW